MVFCVIEGIDGCGKTSLCNRLQDSGFDAVFTREPYDQSIKDLKGLDQIELAYKFAEDRYMHMRDVVIPAIEAGKHIISDRSYLSNLAYQGDSFQSLDWVWGIQPMNLVTPDVVIFLKCDYHIAARRSGEPDAERLFDIQQRYEDILRTGDNDDNVDIYTIDVSMLTILEVFNDVYAIIEEAIKKCEQ